MTKLRKQQFLHICSKLPLLVYLASCSSDTLQIPQAQLAGNLITVDGWVNTYQLNRKEGPSAFEDRPVFPRLKDLQAMLSKKSGSGSPDSPILNPVSKLPEWPEEKPRTIKEYRRLLSDKSSFIGKGKIEYVPLMEGNYVVGYLIRAGDPETGKVFCTNDSPCVRSNP